MRDRKRIKRILNQIAKIWAHYPNLRLCQLIGNCFGPQDLYSVEDDILEGALKGYYDIQR